MIGRSLAADADVLALLLAGAYRHRQQRLDRLVALVEQVGDDAGIPVESEGQLGHVVRADRHPVEVL